MDVVKVNYKSDFKINEKSERVALEVPFVFSYYVFQQKKYVVSFDGHEYVNCERKEDGSLDVIFNQPDLGIGMLMVERKYFIDDKAFADGVFDVVTTEKAGVYLTAGASFENYIERMVVPPYLKGDKGDAMRWETMTEKEREEMVDAIAEAIDPEMVMTENEQGRMANERERVEAEAERATTFGALKDEMETTISDGQKATEAAQEVVKNYDGKIAEQDAKLSELEGISEAFDSEFYITDANGFIVLAVTKDGLKTINSIDSGNILDIYDGEFHISDTKGNVIFTVDKEGLKTVGINTIEFKKNQWVGKVLATYGDSITALNGGDFSFPYDESTGKAKWANKVAKFFGFSKIHNRGIGSTTFKYCNSNGGQIAWCKTETGEYVNRNDSYNYDNYQGNVTIPSDCTPVRGSGSSWLRIKTMFPEAIKDTIDVVLIQFHNDFHQDMNTECAWVEGSNYDTEWANSEYYSTYGGDYNIQTVKGGIASTIMKFQAWMPDALLVLMTPISGVYVNGNDNVKEIESVETAKMRKLAEVVKDIAFKMSIPCIDVYGNDGINTLNHKLNNYITDGIHPYSDEGCKKVARAVISGLNPIIPNI